MMLSPRGLYETATGEGLKTAAEASLQALGRTSLTRELLESYAWGPCGRLCDPRLTTNVAGIVFENPVIVGAGWDKKGRTLLGLHALGFAGVEIGTVLPFPQPGSPRPRLWTIDKAHSVGLNRLGFNSPGMYRVEHYLRSVHPLQFPLGINVGRNAFTENERAAEAHAAVINKLGHFASYISLGISSPNTKELKKLQDKSFLTELIISAREAMPITIPLFIKIDAERSDEELYDMIAIGLQSGLSGFIATNTYGGADLKAAYGQRWANERGGLSGADTRYRKLATRTVRFIYEEAGDLLTIIGVGGVSDAPSAWDKIEAGASAVQVVTAIRPTWGRVAANINRGLLVRIDADGAHSIRDYVGRDTVRGTASITGS